MEQSNFDKYIRNIAIISLYMLGENMRDISFSYNVDKSRIYQILGIYRVPFRGHKYRYRKLK